VGFIDFLREIGKHFSVNSMISKESVRQRIEREGEGLSFAEFSYMLMQAYDFAELFRRFGCTLQLGGSDQWGNITVGIDLCRRLHGAQTHGLTLPLITKADGSKFGKTESGTVWLDPQKTSPYAFYQYWLQTADVDVYRFLAYFTFLTPTEIEELRKADRASGGRPGAQNILAREVTRIVHGVDGVDAAERITQALFSANHDLLSKADLDQLKQDGLPCTVLHPQDLSRPLTGLLVDAGMAASGKQVKDALTQGALRVNGYVCRPEDNMAGAQCFASERALYGRFFLARLGRRTYHLFDLEVGAD
jgi:tyrosyl-tRNA synthetase